MAKVIVQHHVADYDRWLAVFTEHGDVRRSHGATGHAISRAIDDPNTVVIVNDFATVEGAKAFAADPSLPQAMPGRASTARPRSGSPRWRAPPPERRASKPDGHPAVGLPAVRASTTHFRRCPRLR